MSGPYEGQDLTLPVAALMDCPDGRVRRGDELHDPKNWRACLNCGVDCPAESERCFNCGVVFVE